MFNFSSIVFAKPAPQYDKFTFNGDQVQLIEIPVQQKDDLIDTRSSCCFKFYNLMNLYITDPTNKTGKKGNTRNIPCLFMKYYISLNKVSGEFLLYFHGNAEDLFILGFARYFLNQVQNSLQMNAIIMEYPGYGIYEGFEPQENIIEEDAENVYNFIQKTFFVKESNITIFGRSMGSGPACYLSSKYSPKALILMSPYCSIRTVAKQHVSFLAFLLKVQEHYNIKTKSKIKEKFVNIEKAKTIKCPALIIHGQNDNVISFEQGKELFKQLGSVIKKAEYPKHMTHNDFNYDEDIEAPIINFLQELKKLQDHQITQPGLQQVTLQQTQQQQYPLQQNQTHYRDFQIHQQNEIITNPQYDKTQQYQQQQQQQQFFIKK